MSFQLDSEFKAQFPLQDRMSPDLDKDWVREGRSRMPRMRDTEPKFGIPGLQTINAIVGDEATLTAMYVETLPAAMQSSAQEGPNRPILLPAVKAYDFPS